MTQMAIYRRKWNGRGFGGRRYIGCVDVAPSYEYDGAHLRARAELAARDEWSKIIGPGDVVEVVNAKNVWVGATTPAFSGTGLL